MKLPSIDKTLDFIKLAHRGQTYGAIPYWKHPKAVADQGRKLFGAKFDDVAYTAALLHDVIEDTVYDEASLKRLGYTEEILKIVKLLTREKGKGTYLDGIKGIVSSGNKRAMMVKFSDNFINFTGDKSKMANQKYNTLQDRYVKSMNVLNQELGVNLGIGLKEDATSLDVRYYNSMEILLNAMAEKEMRDETYHYLIG